jgi:hypothetical protein
LLRFGVALLIGLVGLQLTACGSTIKSDSAAKFVADNASKQTGFTPKDVKCPDGMDANEGVEFDCHFTGPKGSYTAHLKILKIENDDAFYQMSTKLDK